MRIGGIVRWPCAAAPVIQEEPRDGIAERRVAAAGCFRALPPTPIPANRGLNRPWHQFWPFLCLCKNWFENGSAYDQNVCRPRQAKVPVFARSGHAATDHALRVPFMAFPTHAKYVVIGAGIHGLSTGLAPGREPAQARQGRRQGHPGARQDRHRRRRFGHRLRRHPQQLFPAGHAPADGAQRLRVGERSRSLQLPPRRLHADQPGADARGRGLDLRAAEGRSATSRSSSRARPTARST